MQIAHLLLAIFVMIIWGCNFIFIKFGLNDIPPFLFCAVRFFLASIPAIFFIRLPKGKFKTIALYGLIMFGLQFSFVFLGLYVGMTPGLASVLLQVQVFFSIFFAVVFLGETPSFWQILGAFVSFVGISLVALHLDQSVTLLGFILIISAAASWGTGNLIAKKITNIRTVELVVWGSFVATFPLFAISLIFEGPEAIVHSYQHISWLGIFSLLYVVYVSTWIGYGAWNWLLIRYPISTVAPFTLLIPVIGMLSANLIADEPLPLWKIGVAGLVISGLGINLLGTRYLRKKPKSFQ